MSLVSGLYTLPVGTAFQAYRQTHLELPLEQKSMFGSERIHKGDSRYAHGLSILPGAHIKRTMQPFLDKFGIREDLVFVETPNLGFCSAAGTNRFRQGDAAVLVAPGFYEVDKDACSWLMKHEISHIKHNDGFTVQCVPCVCQLAASIFGMCFLSFLPALGLAFTVGLVSQVSFAKWREAKADDFAIANSSDEELKGGRRLLMAEQEAKIEERTTFWKQVIISSKGDMRLSLSHPSITSRIHKIEKALHTRNVEIDREAERQNLEGRLKPYVVDKHREIEQFVKQMGGTFGLMRRMWSFSI